MNTEELEILYNKISNDNKYRPIIDCITNKLKETIEKEVRTRIMDQFIAKEQLLDRCENNEIIYKIAKADLNENQILAMINNDLKTKNNILIKQNIKVRQELKLYESDDNYDGNVNNILDKIELEFFKKENNELKYYIRNYSTLSKDLYKLQQLDKLVHVQAKKDLFITNPIKYDKYDNNKLVEHINLCNKLLVYNYYDSYNLATYDIREFISNMEDILTSPKYIRNDKRMFDLPVIMISSMDDTDSIFRCIEFGADDYVKKPFDNSILEARINTSIEKRQLREKEKRLLIDLKEEREKSDNLLLNILPRKIADRLKTGEVTIADKHKNVTILFADLVNFTPQAKDLSAQKLVGILNLIFKRFDVSADLYDIEKIKTIGDSYFAVGGLKTNPEDGARKVIQFAKEMILIIKEINNSVKEMNLEIRVGVHTGNVVAGVIGKNKFAYDLWGSTVNMANRLETTSENGKIHISKETKENLGDLFKYVKREKINIKGIGETRTYFIND